MTPDDDGKEATLSERLGFAFYIIFGNSWVWDLYCKLFPGEE